MLRLVVGIVVFLSVLLMVVSCLFVLSGMSALWPGMEGVWEFVLVSLSEVIG